MTHLLLFVHLTLAWIAGVQVPAESSDRRLVLEIPGYTSDPWQALQFYVEPPVGPPRYLPPGRVGDVWTVTVPPTGLVWLAFRGHGISSSNLHSVAEAIGREANIGLDLTYFKFEEEDLARIASLAPGLRGLKLFAWTEEDLGCLFNEKAPAVVMPSLKELVLALPEVDGEALSEFISACEGLERLTLQGKSSGAGKTLATIEQLSSLKSLELHFSPFDAEGHQRLLSIKSLQEFRLLDGHFTTYWQHILEAADHLTSLQMSLFAFPADPSPWLSLLPSLNALRISFVSSPRLHPVASRDAIGLIVQSRSWVGLELEGYPFVDDELLDQIAELEELQWLSLNQSSGFTAEGLRALAAAKSLSFLAVGGCSPEIIEAAKELRDQREDILIFANHWLTAK